MKQYFVVKKDKIRNINGGHRYIGSNFKTAFKKYLNFIEKDPSDSNLFIYELEIKNEISKLMTIMSLSKEGYRKLKLYLKGVNNEI